MAVFAVSFTISDDERYTKLYSALEKKVDFEAKDAVLKQTTSFFMFESSRSAEALIAELFEGVGLRGDVNEGEPDKMIVLDLSNQQFAERGIGPAVAFFASRITR